MEVPGLVSEYDLDALRLWESGEYEPTHRF